MFCKIFVVIIIMHFQKYKKSKFIPTYAWIDFENLKNSKILQTQSILLKVDFNVLYIQNNKRTAMSSIMDNTVSQGKYKGKNS